MKYFTSEWWETGCEDESVAENYREYYLSIASSLPSELRDLEENHTLHDANVSSIHTIFLKNEVTIDLNGWDREFRNPVNYKITFHGVTSFDQTSIQKDCELGDLGYWEYETTNKNMEMRMLFASSAQFSIVFSDFSFSYEQEKI